VQGLPSSHGNELGACTQPEAGLHESLVQTLPSSHGRDPLPWHVPLEQTSVVVHGLPSLHGVPSLTFVWVQPVKGSHESLVQTLPSEQLTGEPPHAPFAHRSFVVQALPSLQESLLSTCVHPVAGLQPSSVHGLPSLQPIGVPAQAPPEHTSPDVQALPSLHGAMLFVWVQPLAGSQASVVQTLLSSQSGGGPPAQAPAAQASFVVQALPSSHGAVLSTCVQPAAASQPSVVQTLPSLQSGPGPPTHDPPAHASPVVHELPSSHGALLFTCVQPVAGSQPSSVHPFASLQSTGSLTQLWLTQRSFVVHWSVSAHCESRLQHPAVVSCWHPSGATQESTVHAFPSSQSGAGPPTQAPPAHWSFVVHALPSLHGAMLFVWVQPVAGSQASVVQTLPSLQSGPGPPTQAPPAQASPVVQALPSSQGALLFAWVQPVAGSHPSSVQSLASPQSMGVPAQTSFRQWSLPVQAFPSLHAAVLFTCVQPDAGSQPSSVQPSASLQSSGAPGTHAPPAHVSFVVQASSSLHGRPLFVWVQPIAESQVSVVQTLPSLQLAGAPPTQLPPEQVSLVVQALPSLHGSLFGVCTQPLAGSQESVVHGLPSLQRIDVPAQLPLVHLSPLVQALLSSHGVLLGCVPSAGQVLLTPSQTSAMSHWAPVADRHTTPDALTPSAGQFGPVPSQVSATSQRSLELRHVPPLVNPSAGQLMLAPVQVSATSHGPAD
jgi:hypothetical protein